MAGELVTGYIKLIPTVQGIQGATAKALGPAAGEAGKAGRRAGGAFGNTFGLSLKKVVGVAAGFLAIKSLTSFIGGSKDAFVNLNVEVKQLQRTAGGSIAEVSALRGAIQLSGVQIPKATLSLKIFAKNLQGSTGSTKKAAAMQKLLGMSYRNSKGEVEDFTTLVPKVADTFAKMADGPAKTALALKLFGRSGADMLPFLNKGSDGIAELEAQAAKLGITLDDTSTKKFTKFREEQRKSTAAMMGLKVTVGSVLLPVFTSFSKFLTGRLVPAFSKVIDYLRKSPRVQGFVDGITNTFDKMGTAVDGALKKLGSLNLNNIDGKKLGASLATALGVAVESLGALGKKIFNKIGDVLGKVDWVGIGLKAGPAVLGFVVGLSAGLLNGITDPHLWKSIWDHGLEILLALAAIAFAPSKLVGPLARILGRIPFVGKFLEFLIKGLNNVGGKLLGAIGRFIGDVGSAFAKGFGRIRLPGAGFITRILSFFKGLPGAIGRFFVGIGETFYLKALGAAGRVGSALRSAFGKIPGALKGAGTLLKKVGTAIVDGLVSGLKAAWHKVTDFISEKVAGLGKIAKKILGINSPSKVFAGIGAGVGEGMALGMKRSMPLAVNAARTLAGSTIISGGPAAGLRSSVAATSAPVAARSGPLHMKITNYDVMTGHLELIADDRIQDNATLVATTGRQR